MVSIRGRILTGTVMSTKMHRTSTFLKPWRCDLEKKEEELDKARLQGS